MENKLQKHKDVSETQNQTWQQKVQLAFIKGHNHQS